MLWSVVERLAEGLGAVLKEMSGVYEGTATIHHDMAETGRSWFTFVVSHQLSSGETQQLADVGLRVSYQAYVQGSHQTPFKYQIELVPIR